MLELVGLLAALVFGLVAYSLLLGQRVIEGRDRRGAAGDDVKEDRPSGIACCGFGLPPTEDRKPN